MRLRLSPPILFFAVLTAALPLGAQQKGQYMPGHSLGSLSDSDTATAAARSSTAQ